MSLVVSSFCALAALAAAQQRTDASRAQVRTKVLPGNGYIRYQVEPGDDQEPAGELTVVHEERKPAPAPQPTAAEEAPAPAPRSRARSCADERGKLLSRLFEMQGLSIDPDFARWLEHNRALGTTGITNLFLVGGEPLLQLAVKTDGIARALAEDLARCEAAHRER
jgi:hypothetical protein